MTRAAEPTSRGASSPFRAAGPRQPLLCVTDVSELSTVSVLLIADVVVLTILQEGSLVSGTSSMC